MLDSEQRSRALVRILSECKVCEYRISVKRNKAVMDNKVVTPFVYLNLILPDAVDAMHIANPFLILAKMIWVDTVQAPSTSIMISE
jgi:hypothetical protein